MANLDKLSQKKLSEKKAMPKLEQFVRASYLIDKAKCESKTMHKGICELLKAKKMTELARLSKFTEDLGKKFLHTLDKNKFKTEDPYKLLKILEKERSDWKEIMKRFKKAKSSEVKAKKGNSPAMIVFKYKNGEIEKYPLELTFNQSNAVAKAIITPLKNMMKGQTEKRLGQKQNSVKSDVDVLSGVDINKQLNDAQVKRILKGLSNLTTPQSAYEKMLNISRYLSKDLLKELSVPFAKSAQIITDKNLDRRKYEAVINEAAKILDKYYPGFSKKHMDAITNEEEKRDLLRIGLTFAIE